MTSAQKFNHIKNSPDCRFVEDFTFESFKQEREDAGFSGDLLLATKKTNPDVRYIIMHTNISDPANEFIYYKIATTIEAVMPEVKLFDSSDNMDDTKFESLFICGSRFIE